MLVIHAHNYGHKNLGDDAMAINVYKKLKKAGNSINTISTYAPPYCANEIDDIPSLTKIVFNYDNIFVKAFIVGCSKLKLTFFLRVYTLSWCVYAICCAYTKYKLGFIPTMSTRLMKLIKGLERSELYFRSGSGSINDIWFYGSFLPQFTEVIICKIFKTKVLFSGQGLGPITGKLREYLLKKMIQSLDLIRV